MELVFERLEERNGHTAGRALLEKTYRRLFNREMPQILLTEQGKPYFADGGPPFSVSHTKKHVFCCVSERNIGIDAEEIGRIIDLRLAEKFLSPTEKARFDAAPDKADTLLRLWVLKESYAKLTGRGIGNYLKDTDFSPDDPRVTVKHGCYLAVIQDEDYAL